MLWDVLLLFALVVAIGVSFSVGSSWPERIILASCLCGLVAFGFYLLTTSSPFAP